MCIHYLIIKDYGDFNRDFFSRKLFKCIGEIKKYFLNDDKNYLDMVRIGLLRNEIREQKAFVLVHFGETDTTSELCSKIIKWKTAIAKENVTLLPYSILAKDKYATGLYNDIKAMKEGDTLPLDKYVRYWDQECRKYKQEETILEFFVFAIKVERAINLKEGKESDKFNAVENEIKKELPELVAKFKPENWEFFTSYTPEKPGENITSKLTEFSQIVGEDIFEWDNYNKLISIVRDIRLLREKIIKEK